MESRFIEQSKQDYAMLLLKNGSLERSKEIANLDAYEPIYKFRAIHEQAEPSAKELNEMINECYIDINALTIGYRDAGKSFHNLMVSADARLQKIKRQLLIEKEKLEDLNILCNQYTDFNSVLNLDDTTLFGDYSYENGIIGARVQSHEEINYNITSVDGNGYEGNDYVLKDDKFLKQSIDTSNRRFINDRNDLTVYEYARITANNSEKEVFPLINFDSIEAKVTFTISSTNEFNKIIAKVSSKDTFLTAVAISSDGISYNNVLPKAIEINNESLKYDKGNYISNSGLLCFPSTKYLKITFQSNGVSDDIIAFEKTVIIEKEKEEPKQAEVAAASVTDEKVSITNFGISYQSKNRTQESVPNEEKYIYNMTMQKLMKHVIQPKE